MRYIATMQEYRNVDRSLFEREIAARGEPAVLRDFARGWPAVEAARQSPDAAVDYLSRFDRGAPVEAFIGPPEIGGRFFYRDDMTGFNFDRRQGRFGDVLRHILEIADRPGAPAVYIGAAPVDEVIPGFAQANAMELVSDPWLIPRIWIGTKTVISTHFDESENIACVVAGRRRFTLFPPDQVANLYVGPLDFTMAGQPASMVSLTDPDLDRYPRFSEALAASQSAELGPGDAIYIPTLWWHHVEALETFNILMNYWWRVAPPEAGSAFEALIHGIWSIGALPPEQREAWRHMFELYVFKKEGEPVPHLEPQHRGILAEPTRELRERIRQFLLGQIGRH
jgi:hypothetical protein